MLTDLTSGRIGTTAHAVCDAAHGFGGKEAVILSGRTIFETGRGETGSSECGLVRLIVTR